MQAQTDTLIDSCLVHKKHTKNVFLFNLRRKFPNFFQKPFFDHILSTLDTQKKELLLTYYTPLSGKQLSFIGHTGNVHYGIYSIVPVLDKSTVGFVKSNKSKEEYDRLLSIYKYDKQLQHYSLTRDITEEEETDVLDIIEHKELFIPDSVKKTIADIFEKIDDMPKSTIVYANMHVDVTHDFFFEHPNEHVPGVMILETFRQFCVAVIHVFGKAPLEDTRMILKSLHSDFFKYTELSFPIKLKGTIRNSKTCSRGYWSIIDFESDVFQNNTVVAHFELIGRIIDKNIYNRLRKNDIEKIVEEHRYIPCTDSDGHFAIKHIKEKKYIPAVVKNISPGGFMLESQSLNKLSTNNLYDFYLYFHDIGYVHGQCKIRWQNTDDNKSGFQIVDIAAEDRENLKEAVIRKCYIDEKRLYYQKERYQEQLYESAEG